jgi:ribose 5-phosphate isomerase B
MALRVAISCDHGGYDLKCMVVDLVRSNGLEVVDMGVFSKESVDYPEKAHALADAIVSGKVDRGILVCGTGIGMSIAANKHPGIRAALCTDPFMAQMSREHNDANVLCLGGRVVGEGLAEEIVLAFLKCEFQGGRHARRTDKLEIQ